MAPLRNHPDQKTAAYAQARPDEPRRNAMSNPCHCGNRSPRLSSSRASGRRCSPARSRSIRPGSSASTVSSIDRRARRLLPPLARSLHALSVGQRVPPATQGRSAGSAGSADQHVCSGEPPMSADAPPLPDDLVVRLRVRHSEGVVRSAGGVHHAGSAGRDLY
jgi:hypothetical protein